MSGSVNAFMVKIRHGVNSML
ncbi:protein of unknown function [Pseudomonas mediterranea]